MKILSFDTSSPAIQVALAEGAEVVAELHVDPPADNRQQAARQLLPCLDSALKESGWSRHDIDLVVAGIGPGSFTGVRVAVITARTLGQALALPVIGVSSLEAAAYAHKAYPVAVVRAAGTDRYFAGAFDCLSGEPVAALNEPFCGSEAELAVRLAGLADWHACPESYERLRVAGHPVRAWQVKNLATLGAQLTNHRLSLKGAGGQLEQERAKLCRIHPWQLVLPLYLRSPSVTLKQKDESSHKTNDTLGS